jgi:hypothetical protein
MQSGRPTWFPDIASRDWCARPWQPRRAWTERPRLFGLAGATLPPLVGHLDRSEHCLDRMRTSVLAVIPLAAVRAHALTLQILDHLLRSHEVLHAVQHRLAFGYAHPQGLQGQLRPLRLASSRWKRSGSSGPHSCSRRSILAKPSWGIWR